MTISLVIAPNTAEAHIARSVHVSAIQLQAGARELTAPSQTAASTPQANALGPTPRNLVKAVATIALASLWYAAFPITLPVSLGLGVALGVALSCLGGCGASLNAVTVLELGFGLFALGPLNAVQAALDALVPHSNSVAAEHRATGGPAGSRRTASAGANVDRMPTTHPTAKAASTQAGDNKRSHTGGSGRGVGKKGLP
ncbi:hypothetical protein [Mycolicibacterium sarraceniae]|uniref:Uncharacterized protein n=1 Tax=Mycolicibacterium sarraceniae TaxID=1534348 RepID=A0A7I7SQP2_9MYCO|nr:hypothetical protein [Mycolicibacterium sarraceniae]BBY59307.1 hypothetical protein MSAR_24430 [Mycolicibacterium sarraceniae]